MINWAWNAWVALCVAGVFWGLTGMLEKGSPLLERILYKKLGLFAISVGTFGAGWVEYEPSPPPQVIYLWCVSLVALFYLLITTVVEVGQECLDEHRYSISRH